MFMYKTKLMAESFNLELIKIEELFEKCFYETFKVIAIDLSDWDYIKIDYNQNKEKYIYQEESIELNDIFNDVSRETLKEDNEIDDMFNDIIEYK